MLSLGGSRKQDRTATQSKKHESGMLYLEPLERVPKPEKEIDVDSISKVRNYVIFLPSTISQLLYMQQPRISFRDSIKYSKSRPFFLQSLGPMAQFVEN